jgi:hypothetical protein
MSDSSPALIKNHGVGLNCWYWTSADKLKTDDKKVGEE